MKQRSNKAASKRFQFSATGKVKRRRVGQSHFNSRDTGKEGRRKHQDEYVDETDRHRITQLLPYS